jgi:hypothetical protein
LESQEIVHGRNVLEQKCLARSSGWQQAVAGNKQWLAASNGWQQAVDGNTQRTAIGSGWQQGADGNKKRMVITSLLQGNLARKLCLSLQHSREESPEFLWAVCSVI